VIFIPTGCLSSDEKRFVKGAGDMAPFIAQHASTHGAHSLTTNNLPVIASDWRYFADTNGAPLTSAAPLQTQLGALTDSSNISLSVLKLPRTLNLEKIRLSNACWNGCERFWYASGTLKVRLRYA
jgi:hypothetical protein